MVEWVLCVVGGRCSTSTSATTASQAPCQDKRREFRSWRRILTVWVVWEWQAEEELERRQQELQGANKMLEDRREHKVALKGY